MFAHFEGADLRKAHLAAATISASYFEKAHLTEAHLEQAFILGSHFQRADLSKVRLEGALFSAFLDRTEFGEAHLEGTNLSRTMGLTAQQLASAYTDPKTILPQEWSRDQTDQRADS